jgi:predicted N-acetyltransferase YhbS
VAGETAICRASAKPLEFDGPRTLRPRELNAARELSALCFGHSTFQDLPRGRYRPTRKQTVEVISHNGAPVCQMGVTYSQLSVCGSRFRVGSVGGVCTHPGYRGMGLATRLLDHCLRGMADRGTRLVLVSGARGLYQRAGCTPAQIFESSVLRRGRLSPSALDVTVRPADRSDADLCARLHQMEPVHFVRQVEGFRHAIESADGGRAGDNWIVEAEGQPVCYVFLRTPWSHGPEDGARELLLQGEWAGSRTALVAALPHLLDRLDLGELWLAAPWQDADLKQLLHGQGVRGASSTLPGHTMRILDFPALMGDLRGYVTSRLTGAQRRGLVFHQEGDGYTIARGSDRLVLDGAGMTRLVLGTPADSEKPRPALGSDLDAIIADLFPLPSLPPGLNCR